MPHKPKSKRTVFFRIVPVVIILIVLSFGCGREPEAEMDSALVPDHIGKARVFCEMGDYLRAVEMYQKAIELYPDNTDAYLQLAIIYDDNLKDKNLAAVYYREFLKREPGAEKADLVRKWLENSQSAARLGPGAEPVRVPSPRSVKPGRPSPSPPPAAGGPLPTPLPHRRPADLPPSGSYTVRGGDTLAGIARELYGDPNAWRRIYQANRESLESPHALKVGQVLTIPR